MRSRVDGNPEEGGWDMIPENAENAEGEYKSRDCFDYFIRICILSVCTCDICMILKLHGRKF